MTTVEGSYGMSSIRFTIKPEELTVGEHVFKVEFIDSEGSPAGTDSTFFFVSLSEAWVLSDYESAVMYLDYLLSPHEKKNFKNAKPEERQKLWQEYWREKDPIPATSENERLVEYFRRIQIADTRFSAPILDGWKS